MMHSAIYRGTVRHRRLGEPANSFRYGVFMMYLDLDELDAVFRGSWLWSTRRPSLAWFRRADFLAGADDLATAVRQRVAAATGHTPAGPIRVLTNLRYFGYIQNPITCYYCFAPGGAGLEYVVVEVTNTPWKQRVAYVLRCDPASDKQRIEFDKTLHVSPFMPMEMTYRWFGNTPGDKLQVHLESHRQGAKAFDATLQLAREEITPARLRGLLWRYPAMTVKVAAGIYWQAAKLFFIKRVRFYGNPHTQA